MEVDCSGTKRKHWASLGRSIVATWEGGARGYCDNVNSSFATVLFMHYVSVVMIALPMVAWTVGYIYRSVTTTLVTDFALRKINWVNVH